MRHLLGNVDPLPRIALVPTLAFALMACAVRPPIDALENARLAIAASADAEPCAQAEVRAARNLLEQAQAAFADRDYVRARSLADAASDQADAARQLAAANDSDCARVRVAAEEVTERQAARTPPPITASEDYGFGPIYFEYDASVLSEDTRRTLSTHAEHLVRNPGWQVRVEGHCDARGSTEYNLALGDHRARAVMQFLVRMGVDPNQIRTLSYGAELPVSADMAQNRRAEFRVER